MYVLALTGPLATLRCWVMAVAVVLTVVTGLDYVTAGHGAAPGRRRPMRGERGDGGGAAARAPGRSPDGDAGRARRSGRRTDGVA